MNGAQVLVEMPLAHGVRHPFGVPGDTSLAWHDALYAARDRVTCSLARGERSAGFMADVYARLTGRPAVCEGPGGAGATYMVPALADANGSPVPLLALTTDNPTAYAWQGALSVACLSEAARG